MKNENHKELIRENLLEEGDPMAVELEDKPHVEIFADFKARIGVNDQYLASNEICDTVRFWAETFLSCCKNERNGCGLGAIGIATEFIVPEIYQHFIAAIEKHSTFDDKASLFFRLHVDCDDGHGQDLVNVITDVAAEPSEREAIRFGTLLALNLRSSFWDAMLARALTMRMLQKQLLRLEKMEQETKARYDAASASWVRQNPISLSDFTGRPFLFEECGDVEGATILDLVCEGYCARHFATKGAAIIDGIDISPKMIEAAKQANYNNTDVSFEVGNITSSHPLKPNMTRSLDALSTITSRSKKHTKVWQKSTGCSKRRQIYLLCASPSLPLHKKKKDPPIFFDFGKQDTFRNTLEAMAKFGEEMV